MIRHWVLMLLLFLVVSCESKEKIAKKGREDVFVEETKLFPNPELSQVPAVLFPREEIKNSPLSDIIFNRNSSNAAFSSDYSVKKVINIGKGSDYKYLSLPIIADGKIFVADGDGKITALSEKNITSKEASVLWVKKINDGSKLVKFYQLTLSYGDGKLFVTTNYGDIVALDANSGSTLWSVNLPNGFSSPVTYENNILYALSNLNETYALNAKTGETIWMHSGIPEENFSIKTPSVRIFHDIVISSHSSGEIFALQKKSGLVLWSQNLESNFEKNSNILKIRDIDTTPQILENGIMFVGCLSGKFYAIDINSGNALWQVDIKTDLAPAMAQNFIFVLDDSDNLVAMHGPSGQIKWIRKLEKYKIASIPRYLNNGKQKINLTNRWNSPIIVNNSILITNNYGDLLLVSPTNGETMKSIKIPTDILLPPVVVGDNMYLMINNKGDLVII